VYDRAPWACPPYFFTALIGTSKFLRSLSASKMRKLSMPFLRDRRITPQLHRQESCGKQPSSCLSVAFAGCLLKLFSKNLQSFPWVFIKVLIAASKVAPPTLPQRRIPLIHERSNVQHVFCAQSSSEQRLVAVSQCLVVQLYSHVLSTSIW